MQPRSGMEDLDRILDRDDVLAPRPVDVVEHRGERRRLAGAGRAGDEDEAAPLLGEPRHARRQAELREVRDLARDDAERERRRAALAEAVDAEPRQRGVREGDVEVAGLVEEVAPLRRDLRHLVEHVLEVGLGQRGRALHLLEVTVESEDRRLPELEVDVARAALDGAREEVDEIDHVRRTSASAGITFTPIAQAPTDAARRGARRARSAAAADGRGPAPRRGGRRRP